MLAARQPEPLILSDIFAPLKSERRIAVAVSGGSDSMALLHLAKEWADRTHPKPDVFVLTVDHGLRPASADEALKVAHWSAELGLNHATLCWQGAKPSSGVQAKARTARYDLMSQWCALHGVSVLLTAHTADDQAETVVMRQQRTQSEKSLAGIWPQTNWNGLQVMRPLLHMRRQELRNYLLSLGQPWIDDPSNDDQRFERVRIRRELAGSVAAEAVAAQAQAAVRQSQSIALNWMTTKASIDQFGMISISEGDLAYADARVQDDILSALLLVGGAPKMPELEKRQSLAEWLLATGGNRRSLGGVLFAKRAGRVLIAREAARISNEPLVVAGGSGVVWDQRFQVKAPVSAQIVSAGACPKVPRRRDIPAFVDAGLPIILMGGGQYAAPFHGIPAGVECHFIGLNRVVQAWNYNLHTLC